MRKNSFLYYSGVLFCLSFISSCIGVKPISIQAETISSSVHKYFSLNVIKSYDSIHVNYLIRDSISSKLDSNSFYEMTRLLALELYSDEKNKRDSINILHNVLDSIENSYSYFTVDSLSMNINDFKEYAKLIKSVGSADRSELLNIDPRIVRIVADGTSVRFIIRKGRRLKKIIVQSPRKDSHPLLNDFLLRSFDLFREGNGAKPLSGYSRTIGW
jgi:hypothetical protein